MPGPCRYSADVADQTPAPIPGGPPRSACAQESIEDAGTELERAGGHVEMPVHQKRVPAGVRPRQARSRCPGRRDHVAPAGAITLPRPRAPDSA